MTLGTLLSKTRYRPWADNYIHLRSNKEKWKTTDGTFCALHEQTVHNHEFSLFLELKTQTKLDCSEINMLIKQDKKKERFPHVNHWQNDNSINIKGYWGAPGNDSTPKQIPSHYIASEPQMVQPPGYKSSAGNCGDYWGPNSFLVKTGHTTAVIKLEGMLGARLLISPCVSLGLRLTRLFLERQNERQVLVRVLRASLRWTLKAKVCERVGDEGHLEGGISETDQRVTAWLIILGLLWVFFCLFMFVALCLEHKV